jgi:serine/threonine protein kinase
MGEVYRARDSRLDRVVAIKVLPARLSADPGLRERFEREARAISSLSHPHICTLFDIGSQDGVDYLVMEYLEGESLAERLERGPLPIDQVLRYGTELAEALGKAHRSGIVHRDLKPGNVILTKGGAKLLDFGLARFAQPSALVSSDPSDATAAMSNRKPLTQEGSILGTFQYMAPEQIEAREADERTDIFALGAVLYEMATGKRAFEAKSKASLIASILDREPPPISTIQPLTPPAFERVVRLCLAKDPDERWQSAHDIAAELKWIGASSSETIGPGARSRWRRGWLRNAALLLFGLVLGAFLAWLFTRDATSPPAIARLTIRTPQEAPLLRQLGALSISPDGTQIVYRSIANRNSVLYRRSIDGTGAVPLAGTDQAHSPTFSPDGRWIAFVARNAIWKIPRDGGTPMKLADSDGGGLGLSWSGDTIIATRAFSGGLWSLPAGGGKPVNIVKTDPAKRERAIVWPQVLPGGKWVLATAWNAGSWDDARVLAYSLEDGSSKVLVEGGSFGRYVPSGHLLFVRGGSLMAVRFDPKTLQAGPNAVAVLNGLSHGSNDGEAHYAVSDAGHLVYATGGDSVPLSSLVWIDRAGVQRPIVPTRRRYGSVAIAPDMRSAVVTIEGATYDIWHLDFERDAMTRISHGGDDADATFSPEGDRVIWASSRSGHYNLWWRPIDNSAAEERLLTADAYQELPEVSPDGKTLVYGEFHKRLDLYVMPLGTRKPQPLIATEFHETAPAVSPDGRWLAYHSDESGRQEAYVTSFPSVAGKWQVSTDGGIAPKWMPDGTEIVYLKDRRLMIAPVTLSPRPRAGRPRVLAEGNFDDEYDVVADGRVAAILDEERRTTQDIQVVLNWFTDLERRVPAN